MKKQRRTGSNQCARYTPTCNGHDCQLCSHNRRLWDDDGNETYLCRQLRDYTPAEIRMLSQDASHV